MSLTFMQDTTLEQWRAKTLTTKEPGTIAWLDELQDGDVFYDVGANIGIYTIYAASKVGPTGHVYAIEPHLANAVSLLKNIEANGFQDRVTVSTVALSRRSGYAPFYYRDINAGASGSQIHTPIGEDGRPFAPTACEIKRVESLNDIAMGWRRPTAIKIDVDGHEAEIIAGASDVLAESWQVEVHPNSVEVIDVYLGRMGYGLDRTHYTKSGQQSINKGADPGEVTHNSIYRWLGP